MNLDYRFIFPRDLYYRQHRLPRQFQICSVCRSKTIPLRQLLDTIRSPYFDLSGMGLPNTAAKPLEIASRYGQVFQGLEQWEESLNDLMTQTEDEVILEDLGEEGIELPQLPKGEAAKQLLEGLHSLASLLTPPAGEISYREWALWLENLLEDLGFFKCILQAGEDEIGAMPLKKAFFPRHAVKRSPGHTRLITRLFSKIGLAGWQPPVCKVKTTRKNKTPSG